MAWGAAWLHMASGKRWYRKWALQYLQDSRKHEPSRCLPGTAVILSCAVLQHARLLPWSPRKVTALSPA